MESIFKLGILLSVIDRVSGPSARIGRGMDGLRGKVMSLGPAFNKFKTYGLIVTTVAAGILNMLSGAAMATEPTQKALGELSSVGVRNLAALDDAGASFSDRWSGTTKAQFISAAYDIKSGISSLSDEGVAEFTKLAALTGKATKSTTAEMTSLFATGYGIYKGMYENLSDMQFGQVFSAGISASVKNFKTTGSGMARAISNLGATAATANVPMAEQLSILGMLQATMAGSEAGTKYKALMQSAAGAGEKLGLQFLDANNQLLSMPEILKIMQGKYGSTLDAMEKIDIQKAFGTQEAVAVIELLYGKIGDLEENIVSLNGAMDQGTAFAVQMATAMNMDPGAGRQLLAQQWNNFVEVIGEQLIPVLVPLFTWIGSLIISMRMFAKEHGTLTRVAVLTVAAVSSLAFVLGGLAAILGAAGLLFPKIPIGLASIGAGLVAVKAGIISATVSVWGFTAALLANPITWVVLAVAGLAWVLYELYKRFDSVRLVIDGAMYVLGYWTGMLYKFGMAVVNGFLHPIESARADLNRLKNMVQGLISWIRGTAPQFLESGKALWGAFGAGIQSMMAAPVETVKSGLMKLRNLLPFSDAKEGPLSTLTLSGVRMMETIGLGIQSAAPALAKTAAAAMAGITVASFGGAGREGPGKMPPREQLAGIVQTAQAKGKEVHIHIGNITLTDVRDPETFIDQLQRLAEGYDV